MHTILPTVKGMQLFVLLIKHHTDFYQTKDEIPCLVIIILQDKMLCLPQTYTSFHVSCVWLYIIEMNSRNQARKELFSSPIMSCHFLITQIRLTIQFTV